MLYKNSDGRTSQVAQSVLEVVEVNTSSHGDDADYLITLRESRASGYQKEFSVIFSEFSVSREVAMKLLHKNGFIFMPYLADVFRYYITEELMRFIGENTLGYFHSGLGFTEMNDGSKQFLLGDAKYLGLTSLYRDQKAEFEKGSKSDYLDFLAEEILPHKATRYALTLGLSSVLASDIRDFADINTIIMNLSGESSTGKTTIAQFIASL